jgi:ribosome biogenesis protein Tsr3
MLSVCPAASAAFDSATAARGVDRRDPGRCHRTRLLRLGMVPVLDTPQEFARIVSDPQAKASALSNDLDPKLK